ncbi:splicing factor ESS-2 homolog [Daktulosphaira vitifoliae]|uniref:splicing factor ESS-2 homolog n=1 Tax=Daktulosphaira vitifoliae TaxID=58002 RepID=UPI0021AB0975|nr:splicing factor ESS-2 homolog [Daktulosphaira vitifoliae]
MANLKEQIVLPEEEYLENIGKIIERDFFPDLEKWKTQKDYLDAIETNDTKKLREIYEKYSISQRLNSELPDTSPDTFETPQPAKISFTHVGSTSNTEVKINDYNNEKNENLSLDKFLSNTTSEDNQSFNEIIKESEIQFQKKNAWLFEGEKKALDMVDNLQVPSIEDQAVEKERPFNLDSWTFKNKNYIMYVPDGVQLTKDELISMASKRQKIDHSNTRLRLNPFNEQHYKQQLCSLAHMQTRQLDGKIGVDGKELTSITPKVNGYGFVKTPSPAPGVNQTPLMTWGEIEGTPFRLDGSDTPLTPNNSGPTFKIPEQPKRERLAHALAEKASEGHRNKKIKALETARKQLSTPSPSHLMTSPLDRLNNMSPAAQRLVFNRYSNDRRKDNALRASYSPSPQSTPTRSPAISALKSDLKKSTPTRQKNLYEIPKNLTDNLLNINVTKRSRAVDFF